MALILVAGLIGSLTYAAIHWTKPAVEEPAFPPVNTWQELVKEYLAFRDSSYPLVPPDEALTDAQSLDGVDVEALKAGPEWYWTFNQNTFYFNESSDLAKQIAHNTELIVYEDMATDELIILSVPEKEGADYKEEIVFRAQPWPKPGILERPSRYLFRELSKRRIVWRVTMKSQQQDEKETLLAARPSSAVLPLSSGGGMQMMRMYTGAVEEVQIVFMKKATNGLLLEIGYPSGYTGTSWSVYSFDAEACV
ncbi:MAG: hypothetical protein V2A34_04600, partial [Lentisphaerota bacterium]